MHQSIKSAARGTLAVMLGSVLAVGCGGDSAQPPAQSIGQNSQAVSTSIPAPMGTLGTSVVSMAGGGGHGLAVKSDGTVWAWGANMFGQLGIGGSSAGLMFETPVQVPGLANAKSVSAYAINSAVVLADGSVYTWGVNGSGQLGNGHAEGDITPSPVKVTGISSVVAAAVGVEFCVALKSDGTVWAWGSGEKIGNKGNGSYTPVKVYGLSDVTAISAGFSHAMALKSDGTVWVWGMNGGGLGNAGTYYTPVQVPGLSNIKSISAGSASLAVDGSGNVWAWGSNENGQIGDGSTTPRSAPVRVKTGPSTYLSGIKTVVATEEYFSLAVGTDGSLWAWGRNDSGQLGNGTTTNSSYAVRVGSISNVRFVDGTGSSTLALVNSSATATSGTPWSWGADHYGQLGNGSL